MTQHDFLSDSREDESGKAQEETTKKEEKIFSSHAVEDIIKW